jgi:DNA primase
VDLEKKVIRLLMAQPALAADVSAAAVESLAALAPDGGAMLRQLLDTIQSMGAAPSFAALAEQLRAAGSDFDGLIAEILADAEYEPEVARLELRGAVRQCRMKLVKAEMDRLTTSNSTTPEVLSRLRELWSLHEKLKQQEAADAVSKGAA